MVTDGSGNGTASAAEPAKGQTNKTWQEALADFVGALGDVFSGPASGGGTRKGAALKGAKLLPQASRIAGPVGNLATGMGLYDALTGFGTFISDSLSGKNDPN